MQSTEPSPGSSSATQALPISTSRLPSTLPAQVLITKGHGLTSRRKLYRDNSLFIFPYF